MAISEKEIKFERKKLGETKSWLSKEIKVINNNDIVLKDKIAALKKEARGRYSEELDTAQKLYEITHKNLENYNEAGEQPYFARIDFREYRKETENFYIGKFGLGDSKTGDEVVIDWRAPIADLYYSGTQGEAYYVAPAGVINGELSLKRKFLIRKGELTDAFDEGIDEIILRSGAADNEGKALIDEYLRINLEESIGRKLKDVVATIQKEQNAIIRAEKNNVLIVQGSAGSGKTTVALHRLAYLLYKHKNKLTSEDILVIAPNKLFLDYISDVLPNLGVDKVRQKTFEEMALGILDVKGKIYSKDKKLSFILESKDDKKVKMITYISRLKGTISYKTVIDRYLRYLEKRDIQIADIEVDGYKLFDAAEIKRLYSKDLIHLPLNKRKDDIKRYFTLKLKDKINDVLDKIDFTYEYLIARTKKIMEDGTERRKKLIELYDERDVKKENIKKRAREEFDSYFDSWRQIDTKRLYSELFLCREVYDEVTDDKIPSNISECLIKEIGENLNDGIIDSDDLAAMLYLKFKIDGVPEGSKYQHVVVDEAQDYSMLQLLVLKTMAQNNSFTIVGDIGQGIYYYKGIESWQKLIEEVFGGEGNYISLTQSYRSTVEIIDFANEVLKKQKNSLIPAIPVLRHGRSPEVIEVHDNKGFATRLDKIVQEVEVQGKKSVAVVGRTMGECKKIREQLKKYSEYNWELIKDTDASVKLEKIIIPSYMTKGLEFDCTVIYNCDEDNYGENELDKKILYVALTRALHLEYIFFRGNISPLIKGIL